MKDIAASFRRSVYLITALLLAGGVVLPTVILSGSANAAQVTSRTITMQNSAPGTTGTQYEVSFKVATNMTSPTLKGVVIEFCNDTPLPGQACDITDSGGTVVPTVTSTANPFTNLTGTSSISGGTWTPSTMNSAHTVKLTGDATGVAVTPGDANPVMFKFVATNPSTTAGSFYARIYAYTDLTELGNYTGGAVTGAYVDYGGVALSTANQISITTRVQEKLTFCVQKAATSDCTVGGAPTLDIGSGTPKTIDNGAIYTDDAYFGLATNASTGAAVRMRGNTLTSGTNSIASMGAAFAQMTAGTENFGLQVDPGATGVTGDANYWDAQIGGAHAAYYGFDLANTYTASTGYGDRIAYTTLPIGSTGAVDVHLTFGATASLVTPAGLYSTALDLIATGTY
jgi:hypothetical protein